MYKLSKKQQDLLIEKNKILFFWMNAMKKSVTWPPTFI